MSLTTITRRFEIDAGHRLMNHGGKCRNYHGHRYAFHVTLAAPEVDPGTGMIVDFGLIKEEIGGWLDTHWDHAMILEREDRLAAMLWTEYSGKVEAIPAGVIFISNPKLYIVDCPPTAENLARIFAGKAQQLAAYVFGSVKVTGVSCWETPNCSADHFLGM